MDWFLHEASHLKCIADHTKTVPLPVIKLLNNCATDGMYMTKLEHNLNDPQVADLCKLGYKVTHIYDDSKDCTLVECIWIVIVINIRAPGLIINILFILFFYNFLIIFNKLFVYFIIK